MGRLEADKYTYPWGDAQACPCGSDLPFAGCCKTGQWKLPYIKMPSLMPAGPPTAYGHPRCYMASTQNCSTKISKEHYISQAILDSFPNLNVSGLPWHSNDDPVAYRSTDLTANILCTRHNSALSPIDALAAHAFCAFTAAPAYVTSRLNPGRVEHFLVSGDAVELWMFKLLAGMFFGGIATDEGVKLSETRDVDRQALVRALSGEPVLAGAGLYVVQAPGEMPRQVVRVVPYSDTRTNCLAGLRVNFGTLSFETFLTPPPRDDIERMVALRRYRPGAIDFNGPARDARIVMTWRDQRETINRLGFELAAVPTADDKS